jgi:hypothetical protein
MAEGAEFWREFKPVAQVFRPGAMPEASVADAATDDDRYYAPLSETVGTRPLWISPSQNRWCDVLMCRGAGLVNRHHHPAAGVRLHDLRQVGVPGARLGGHRGRLDLRGAWRGAHADRLRVRRADAGHVQRHRAAHLAGRERRAERPLRRVRLHQAVPGPLREGRDRRGLRRPAVPFKALDACTQDRSV